MHGSIRPSCSLKSSNHNASSLAYRSSLFSWADAVHCPLARQYYISTTKKRQMVSSYPTDRPASPLPPFSRPSRPATTNRRSSLLLRFHAAPQQLPQHVLPSQVPTTRSPLDALHHRRQRPPARLALLSPARSFVPVSVVALRSSQSSQCLPRANPVSWAGAPPRGAR
ncbi:hypothetical protein BDA96_02G398300 [Sorghum bicolor]|uniref:Uncharacterized protein n=2 Tax=Sorghum bicolor TaxID=4558 RepID=A0A921RSK1_SORBI|nr:hypothetical protein BDA96_02G398300 [Sorghum bicolor]OQU90284.1 hypothetical protein SORBI_3002G379750 [Sorghum bicolor]